MPPRKINPGPDAKPTPRVSPPGAEDSGIGRLPPQPDNEPLPGNLPGRLGDWVSSLGRDLDAPERDRFERDIRRILRSVAMTDSLFPRGPGTLSPPLLVTGGGSTRLDRSGVSVYNGNVNTIRLEDDGDAFFGSNLAAPATTSFIVFSNAQTYNSESMGAGDVLLGDNSTSKANVLWDASAGKILFRGGTTEQGSIDIDGSAMFGGGLLLLNTNGLILDVLDAADDRAALKWKRDAESRYQGQIRLYNWGGGNANINTDIQVGDFDLGVDPPISTLDMYCYSDKSGGGNSFFSLLELSADDTAGEPLFLLTDGQRVTTNNEVIGYYHSTELVFNNAGRDINLRIESDTRANAVILDAGLHAFQIGGATVSDVAGDIADFRATTIVFNEDSYDIDFRVESNGDANMLFVDGGADRVGIGTGTPSTVLHILNATPILRVEDSAASSGGGGGRLDLVSNDGAAVVTNDMLGQLLWLGHDGTSIVSGARLRTHAGSTWSDINRESFVIIETAPSGSTTLTEALRVLSNQTLKLSSANSWTANGTGTVTISNLAPAGVGTATISKWLTITDNAGVVMYIPCFT